MCILNTTKLKNQWMDIYSRKADAEASSKQKIEPFLLTLLYR